MFQQAKISADKNVLDYCFTYFGNECSKMIISRDEVIPVNYPAINGLKKCLFPGYLVTTAKVSRLMIRDILILFLDLKVDAEALWHLESRKNHRKEDETRYCRSSN